MNWAPTEMQGAIRELARDILEKSTEPFGDLAEAGVLDLDDPLDVCTLLIEVGRAGSNAPLFEHLVLGQGGSGERRTGAWIDGSTPTRVEGGQLFGSKICVPAASASTHAVVTTPDGLYEVALSDCQRDEQLATDDQQLGVLGFEGTPATRLDQDAADWELGAQLGRAAVTLGLCKAALKMTSQYVSKRQQFGKPIATFQAVSQRAADAWIDVQSMEVTLWQAASQRSRGNTAQREVLIAAWWAAEGSHKVLSAAQHLHGGMGFDRDYPLHGFYLMGKRLEFVHGGASQMLQRLGALQA